jgi:hypothetical protein
MTKIQIDLDAEEDRIVEIYKLVNKLKTKEEAIKKMVRYFEAEVKPRHMDESEYKKALKFGDNKK